MVILGKIKSLNRNLHVARGRKKKGKGKEECERQVTWSSESSVSDQLCEESSTSWWPRGTFYDRSNYSFLSLIQCKLVYMCLPSIFHIWHIFFYFDYSFPYKEVSCLWQLDWNDEWLRVNVGNMAMPWLCYIWLNFTEAPLPLNCPVYIFTNQMLRLSEHTGWFDWNCILDLRGYKFSPNNSIM